MNANTLGAIGFAFLVLAVVVCLWPRRDGKRSSLWHPWYCEPFEGNGFERTAECDVASTHRRAVPPRPSPPAPLPGTNIAFTSGARDFLKPGNEGRRFWPVTVPDLFMVFDVESIGLHGEGFAFGYIVVNLAGETLDHSMAACDPDQAAGDEAGRRWVRENVPVLYAGCKSPREVREEFWQSWNHWKALGAVLVADCAWPVEARFLAACVDDEPGARAWEGPYPLHDLASVLLALGHDPLAANERLPSELPAHHPAKDAQQSARLLRDALVVSGCAVHGSAHPCEECAADLIVQQERHDFRALLDEVRQCFTRDDDLPGDLLRRIDAAIDAAGGNDVRT